MMDSVDLVILMEVLAEVGMVLVLIGHLVEGLGVGLVIMVGMGLEMTLVVVLGAMVAVVVVAMLAFEENRHLATLVAMDRTWVVLVLVMATVG